MQYDNETIRAFVDALAGKDPVPGGGGASALVGAVGIALGNMVGSLTVGKPKYAAIEHDMRGWMAEAAALQTEFLHLVDADAAAFKLLAEAYRLPAGTDGEKTKKARVMEPALHEAAFVPLSIMEACCKALDLVSAFAEHGSALAISDAGCAASLCRAALESASLNVFINTKMMTDRAHAERVNARVNQMRTDYVRQADAIFNSVLSRLK